MSMQTGLPTSQTSVPKNLNGYFDSTLLKPEATGEQIIKLCREAAANGFFAVCINPCRVGAAKTALSQCKTRSILRSDLKSDLRPEVKIATVIGFPLGASTTAAKVFETERAIRDGADEIDMVINLGLLKDKKYAEVSDDIAAVVCAATKYGAIVKVILETCLLTDDEIQKACILSRKAGAAFVKTSTGFSTGGATTHAVKLMKQTVGDSMRIKASDDIRNLKTAIEMIDAGADRLGCSSCAGIIREAMSYLPK